MKYKKVIKLTPQHLKERYGNGYVMLLKLSPDFPDVIPVKVFIKQHLPEAVLKVIKLFLRHLLTGPRASWWGLLGFGDHRSSYLILERLLMLSTICWWRPTSGRALLLVAVWDERRGSECSISLLNIAHSQTYAASQWLLCAPDELGAGEDIYSRPRGDYSTSHTKRV